MSKIDNVVSIVYDYTLDSIQRKLDILSEYGYKLVSTESVLKNDRETMYLFFTKEVDE